MKKNTSGQTIGAQLVSASNGSAFTGAVTCYVCGDGGTQAAGSVGSGACTHEGNGFHTYAPAQAETNYDHVAFTFTGTGAIPVTVQVYPGFPQTGDNYARLGAPAGASLAADVAAVKTDTAAVKTKTDYLPSAAAGAAGGVFIAGANAATTVNITGDITGNLSGSVGSVTGAVGSVTGNVGGNVGGSVGSISGVTFPANFGALGINASGHVSRVTLADTVTTLTGHTPQTGDSFARIGANGAGLTSLATAAALATVDGILDNVYTAFELDGSVYRLTTNALEQAPSGGLNATQVADAVWDAVINDHLDAGSTGASLNAAGSAGDPWTTTLPGSYTGSQAGKILSDILADTGTDGVVIASGQTMEMSATELRAALGMSAADLDSQLDAIVADTNELQADWANGGRLDLILDARASQSSVDTIDGIVDSILLDTAEIGAAGAGLTALPWNAAWDAEAQSEANDALVALGLDHLVSAAVVGADVTDNSIIAKLASKSATADWDDFVNTTDSLQAIRDRGDAAWTGDGGGGGGQPRINQPPAPAYTVAIDRITHRGSRKIWLTPGTVGDIAVFVDMAPLFGANNYVATVGTPTVSGGSVTATELGPRDTYAVVELSGTATASEERTVDVAVTMETGEQISIEFDFEVFAE